MIGNRMFKKITTFSSWFTGLSILLFILFGILSYVGVSFVLPVVIKIIWIVIFIPTLSITMWDDNQQRHRAIFESGYKAGKRDRNLDQEFDQE
jgi:amino acid permease